MRLVLASDNPGKLAEFRRLLAPLGFEVIPQADLGVAGANEPYDTFVENALAKARHASRATGLPALADDSGVCVDALGGAPGVRSARYAAQREADWQPNGKDHDAHGHEVDARNNAALIAALAGVTDRRAHYTCVLVFLRHATDPEPILTEGVWHGRIVDVARGRGGFGYDPYFEDLATGLTGAELPLERKNELSHRGQAMRALIARFREDGRRGR